MDRSLGLLGIAKEQDGAGDVVRGDLGGRGWRDGVFVSLCHHLLVVPPWRVLRIRPWLGID